jgi:dolichol kinase
MSDDPGAFAGMERAFAERRRALGQFVGHLEFDPHWFRRAFHAFGACFVIYYLLPDQGATMGFVKGALPLLLFVGALTVEAYRILGGLPTEAFFGLREYERYRISGYVYFASSVTLLLYAFPPGVAAACIIGAAIGDPILGEFRRAKREHQGWVACFAFGMVVFTILGFHPALGVLGSILLIAGELAKNPILDDDFMMPIVPAVVLVALQVTGVLAMAGLGFPDPFPHQVEVPAWLP